MDSTKGCIGGQGFCGYDPEFKPRANRVFARSACESNDQCCIIYQPCSMKAADVAKLEPEEQHFYTNHIGVIEKRTCTMHPDKMCIKNATMQVHDVGFPNAFSLDCVVGFTPRCMDDPNSGFHDFCFTHLTTNCFAVVNYRRLAKPAAELMTPRKPLLTQSTHSMLMARIPHGTKFHDDEIDVKEQSAPGMQRLLFAMDHYQKKDCDEVVQHACASIWDHYEERDYSFNNILLEVLPKIVPSFADCIRMHRILLKLWEGYNRSENVCYIKDCLCTTPDSDSEDE